MREREQMVSHVQDKISDSRFEKIRKLSRSEQEEFIECYCYLVGAKCEEIPKVVELKSRYTSNFQEDQAFSLLEENFLSLGGLQWKKLNGKRS